MFKVLSIDGGGLRGVFPAHILNCVETRLGVNLFETFDMIAGTSTGSIIAAGIACHKKPAELISFYREYGSAIFGTRIKSWLPKKAKQGFHSVYENNCIAAVLKKEFGDIKLGDIQKPLLIPATDVGHGGVHVFKSGYSRDFTRDVDVLVSDAVLASCSAPTFFNPSKVDNYLLADGGVWANNPALAVVIDARYRLGIDLNEIRVLSLGTGQSRTAYGTNADRKWGLINGWGGKAFINFLLSLQAQSTQNYLQLMLPKHQLVRVDFESDNPLPLDDIAILDDLISRADRAFTHQSSEIANLLSTSGGL